MARSRKISALIGWHQREKVVFESLARTAESILQNLIKKAGIPIVSVSSRVKTSESLAEKQRRKRYKNPTTEITDFVGLRVITYTEDDATLICNLVEKGKGRLCGGNGYPCNGSGGMQVVWNQNHHRLEVAFYP